MIRPGNNRPAVSYAGKLNVREDSNMVKDPVCGMEIEESSAAGTADYEGKTYYFCSSQCQTTFEADPKSHVETE
jgi:Cu+-exporting ATPase